MSTRTVCDFCDRAIDGEYARVETDTTDVFRMLLEGPERNADLHWECVPDWAEDRNRRAHTPTRSMQFSDDHDADPGHHRHTWPDPNPPWWRRLLRNPDHGAHP